MKGGKIIMKHVGTVLGATIAGLYAMIVWGELADSYGILGGWAAGLIIISLMWTLNHYAGLINNDGAFVDMAVGIGTAGFVRDTILNGGGAAASSIPTLIVVIIGGIIGGVMAYKLEVHLAEKEAKAEEAA